MFIYIEYFEIRTLFYIIKELKLETHILLNKKIILNIVVATVLYDTT